MKAWTSVWATVGYSDWMHVTYMQLVKLVVTTRQTVFNGGESFKMKGRMHVGKDSSFTT